MLTDDKNFFKILSKIDVSKYAQKRNGLDYLPWAVAWRILREHYPESSYTVYENEGINYFTDGRTAWVKVGLTLRYPDENNRMVSLENVEYLACMDYRHNSIPLEKLQSTDVIKTIQRCLCKCAARFGIGISLYGADLEDLPEAPAPSIAEDTNVISIHSAMPDAQENSVLIEDLRRKLEASIKEYTKDMDRKAKVEFVNTTVKTALDGERNYKLCNDPTKLKALLDRIEVNSRTVAA